MYERITTGNDPDFGDMDDMVSFFRGMLYGDSRIGNNMNVKPNLPSFASMFKFHIINNKTIAELTDKNFIINEVQDALDLMADLGSQGYDRMIICERNLAKDFFDLKTGLVGEILQKFSNYKVKLAIVGDFSKYTSKSLRDSIRESNRGKMIFFAEDLQSALLRL